MGLIQCLLTFVRRGASRGDRQGLTYILNGEDGASLRAAGCRFIGKTKGGSWNRLSRDRVDKHPIEPKFLYGLGNWPELEKELLLEVIPLPEPPGRRLRPQLMEDACSISRKIAGGDRERMLGEPSSKRFWPWFSL